MNDVNESHEESPRRTPATGTHDEASQKLRRRRVRDSGLGRSDSHMPESTRRWRERFKS
ncbi:MAG TPA: hypothetical protein VFF75_08385 [Methylophilaceae bacterium]|nr:hypothetical protein [Methylophilaceae bacterium]